MKARLATEESFKQAGLDYAPTLLSIKFNLEKRPDGKAVIKLSSDRPINDPFVDMLMELNWSSGRLSASIRSCLIHLSTRQNQLLLSRRQRLLRRATKAGRFSCVVGLTG